MAELLRVLAADAPDGAALIDEAGETSRRSLDERVNRLVHAFRARGVAEGSTLALMARNRREWFEIQLAALHAGVTLVPVNWHWRAKEIGHVLDDSGAALLIVEDEFAGVAAQALAGRTIPAVVIGKAEAPAAEPYESVVASGSPEEPAGQSLALPMFYTSGTTGVPKGVRPALAPAPPAVLAGAAEEVTGRLGIPAGGVTLLAGPIHHQAQWSFSVLPLLLGSTVVMRSSYDTGEILRLIDAHRVTNVNLVPIQFVRMLRLPEAERAAFDGSSLVVAVHGAAPCPVHIKQAMLDWWGPRFTEFYGGTEGGLVSSITAREWLTKPGSVGRPAEHVDVRILDEDGAPVPAGRPGRIWTRDRRGLDFRYHNDPGKTAAAHRDGLMTLGDVGHLDEDGYLYLSDRDIDMIISGGVNIYPAEIEGVLLAHAAVADAAVFGIPNDEYGEEVKALVQPVPGVAATDALAAELIAHCREELAGYKAPRSLDFVRELPRTPSGKLPKRSLRAPYWRDRAGRV
ncbi:AMP-binding protein [Actinomadura sp. B10D3]|uniref:AMP-binding protein n=1 Tax=Actinomadura sp. B10D3 TaxID=3153557 RepID=UPI00325C9A32